MFYPSVVLLHEQLWEEHIIFFVDVQVQVALECKQALHEARV
jgi:hypothetical protein